MWVDLRERSRLLAPLARRRLGPAALLLVGVFAHPPGAFADDNTPWVGQRIMIKKAGVRIGYSDDAGRQIYVAELTDLVYTVLKEEDTWLEVRHRGVQGWFDREHAILLDDALAFFAERIRAKNGDAFTFAHRGRAWQEEGELERALRDLNEAIRLDPNTAAWFSNRGGVYDELEEYDRALRDYSETLRLDPKDARTYHSRGLIYKTRKEYKNAIADYSEAIRLDPKWSHAYFNRANAYKAQKDYDKAIGDYGEAIRLDPKRTDSYFNRAGVYKAQKEYDKAVGDYGAVIRLDPEDADAHSNLAWLLATCPEGKVRDGKKAVELATKACELTSWRGAYFQATLAAAWAETGNFEEALRWQHKALESRLYQQEEGELARQRLKLFEDQKPCREE
ncbi:MAG TPA: tetratricopeptide repeat protein [Gemmataceae bacterium]